METILTISTQGGIVILAVAVLRLLLKKAPKRFICLLWLLAGLRLLLPFQIESNLSLQPNYNRGSVWEGAQTIVAPEDHSGHGWGEILDAQGNVLVSKPLEPIPGRGEILDSQGNVLVSEPLGTVGQIPNTEKTETNWKNFLPYIWVLCMVAMGASSVTAYLQLKKRVRDSVILSDGVWVTGNIDTAFVLGFFRPQIYLPVWLAEEHREFVLAHERSHIARRDHWWKLLGYLTLSIHWFNPLVWLGYILLCRDLEMACDENVVKTMDLSRRKAYSAALVSCSAVHPTIAACPVAFGEVSVKERVKHVLNFKKPGFWISLVAILAAILVAVFLLTSPGKEQEETLRAGYKGPGEEYTYFHSTEREKKWEEDVLFLAEKLLTEHPYVTDGNFFIVTGLDTEYSNAMFDPELRNSVITQVNQLIPELGELSDTQILWELQRIMALLDDADTSMAVRNYEGEEKLPLVLESIYENGEMSLYATRIPAVYESVLYTKLTAINGIPVEEVIAKVAPYVVASNENMKVQRMVGLMRTHTALQNKDVLQILGIVGPEEDSAELTFETESGMETCRLEFVSMDEYWDVEYILGTLSDSKPVQYRYVDDKMYWYEILAGNIFYVNIVTLFNYEQRGFDLEKFLIEVDSVLKKAEEPMRLVMDFRIAGSGYDFHDEFSSFAKRVNQRETNGVYILINGVTYDAGADAAYRLSREIDGAKLVGTPAGSGVNYLTSTVNYTLPNSGLKFYLNTKLRMDYPEYTANTLTPDVVIYQTLEDYKNGIDTVFEAAVNGLQREFDIFLGTATMEEEEKEFDVSLGAVTVTEPEE